MNQRFLLAGHAAVFIAGIAVGVVLGGRSLGDAAEFRRAEAGTAEGHPKRAAAAGSQTRLEVTGTGPGISDEFDLAQGRARITVEHDGHSWLSVDLSEVTHGSIGSLAFASGILGPWKTRAMAGVPHAGRYRIQVQTDGNWKVTVAQ